MEAGAEGKAPQASPAGDQPQGGPVVDSGELFGAGRLVFIRHGSDWYRLAITRQGKLILTK